MGGFRVTPYSIDELVRLLAQQSEAEASFVQTKPHRQYFEDYFKALEAKTIVVEEGYVDHDYLEDFTGYYARCFSEYKKTTTRLHFFKQPFDAAALSGFLSGTASDLTVETLQQNYLGFVVVKPLPETIIGRTCLQSYPSDQGRRQFPILRDYDANLFGIRLSVSSLAYQEQDSVVAACATSALWSCFQGTGRLFGHASPSPVEITKAAAKSLPEESFIPHGTARALPTSGLTATQMAAAVREVGLEPHIETVSDPDVLNSTIYAYASARIPCVLVVNLYDGPRNLVIGRHAVTVAGFSLGHSKPNPIGATGVLLRSSRIDRLYAHDDQVGPFARMVHTDLPPVGKVLSTSWPSGNVYACPDVAIVPLYNKIRIPFSWIQRKVVLLDNFIELLRARFSPSLQRPEWDIYLTTVNEFKSSILEKARHSATARAEEVLTLRMPKYLWCAIARCGADEHLGLIFDATGIQQSDLLVGVVEFRPDLGDLLRPIPWATAGIDDAQVRGVLSRFSVATTPAP